MVEESRRVLLAGTYCLLNNVVQVRRGTDGDKSSLADCGAVQTWWVMIVRSVDRISKREGMGTF